MRAPTNQLYSFSHEMELELKATTPSQLREHLSKLAPDHTFKTNTHSGCVMAKWFTGIAGYAVCFNQSNIPESEWFWHCKLADALDKEHAESCTVTQVLAMMERMGL